MNINQKIEKALSDVTENIWPSSCPEGEEPELYIVYNPELEAPGSYADDKAQDWVTDMQVHLYIKGNYISVKNQIRRNLEEEGFTVTGIETINEKESGYFHLIFLCYIEEE